jgi:hypothetical protein
MLGRALLVLLVACSRPDPPNPWVPPPEPAWGPLPKDEAEAQALVTREAVRSTTKAFDVAALYAIRPDATKLVVGEDAIAAAYDGWMVADPKKPAYLMFGTLHDSRAQIEAVVAIATRMRTLWGLALEQFRTRGRWTRAPETPSADDADLLTLGRAPRPDDDAIWRLSERQVHYDHAAWKFDYVPALVNVLYAARGAGLPILGCDMPPELRVGTGEADSALRELHCARSLRAVALSQAATHAPPDAGLVEDDPAPPERFAVLVGANHAEPDGLPRFLKKGARFALVRVLGGRPADAQGEESELASKLAVLDPIVVRPRQGPDALLLPDGVWGGNADRTIDHDMPLTPKAPAGLPRPNVIVTSDETAWFGVGESSVEVTSKPEWVSARAGHEAFVLTASVTMLGAVDVPPQGYVELHFAPKARSVRIVVHSP